MICWSGDGRRGIGYRLGQRQGSGEYSRRAVAVSDGGRGDEEDHWNYVNRARFHGKNEP